ncbi:MAG: hypothetical protein FJW14_00205 [Acidimicrobiia bacterium]|nr:hypothetical protein [Acidimicrobiia bacterium]
MKLTVAALVAVLTAACAGPEIRGPFRNQYIDVDTGKPIQGVVFLAVWEKVYPTVTGDGGRYFYEAREAVSGPDGRVEIPAVSPLNSIFTLEVTFHAFGAGYGYADDNVLVTPPSGKAYIDPTVTRMRRLPSREERCQFLRHLSSPSVPENTLRIPKYLAVTHGESDALRCGSL